MIMLPAIIQGVGSILDNLITTDEERAKLALQDKALDVSLLQGQIDVNREQAKHASVFVAGARPALLWTGVGALTYQFMVYPLLTWAWALLQAADWVPRDMGPPPMLDIEALMVLMTGVLGLGGYRTFEKVKGRARDNL